MKQRLTTKNTKYTKKKRIKKVDEFDGLLSDREFLQALSELEEATRMAKGRKRMEPAMRRLELAARKFFRTQGSLFMRKFRTQLRSKFEEGFEGHTKFLNTSLQEALSPLEWLIIWYEVTQATDKSLSDAADEAIKAALLAGAIQSIAEAGIKLSFSLANPRAVAYMQNYGAQLVKNIDEETRSQIQTILNDAIGNGWSYDKAAQAITDKFEQFAVGSPLEHIDSRAHLVAVTEMGNAYCEGNLEVAQELAGAGIEMEKFWSTVGDDKVSQTVCAPNEAQGWIPLDQAFQSGHERPLGHPGCRCDLRTRRRGD